MYVWIVILLLFLLLLIPEREGFSVHFKTDLGEGVGKAFQDSSSGLARSVLHHSSKLQGAVMRYMPFKDRLRRWRRRWRY